MCLLGKKKIRILHQLDRCHLLPGVDFLDCSYHGVALPRTTSYDCICRLCAREGVYDGGDSWCTESSSSTSADGRWLTLQDVKAPSEKSPCASTQHRDFATKPLYECHPGTHHSLMVSPIGKFFGFSLLSSVSVRSVDPVFGLASSCGSRSLGFFSCFC